MAMEMARRTLTSLKGGLSWASARPNTVCTVLYSCTAAAGVVLRMAAASARLATKWMSLCPERKAARRVAASGVERMWYSST